MTTTWKRGVLMDPNRGPAMITATGKWFYPLDPRPDEVSIIDIAHSLSRLSRFGGHTFDFYSVAQHSVIVSQHLPIELALVGLLHDATEAYVGDLIAPIKRQLPAFEHIEHLVWCAIVEHFNLTAHGVDPTTMALPSEVKEIDSRLLATELRQLTVISEMGLESIGLPDNPLDIQIHPHSSPRESGIVFARCFHELTA